MLRISRLTDYGIVLLAHLAREGAGRPHAARELAEQTQLPLPVVSKILKQLAHQGILVSQRGARGGYGLARDPGQVRVSEIIAALEGPVGLTECTLGPGRCDHEGSCLMRTPWRRINQAIGEALARVTLAELAGPPDGDWAHFDDPKPDPFATALARAGR
jgi:FeS assembly SUF system regulator